VNKIPGQSDASTVGKIDGGKLDVSKHGSGHTLVEAKKPDLQMPQPGSPGVPGAPGVPGSPGAPGIPGIPGTPGLSAVAGAKIKVPGVGGSGGSLIPQDVQQLLDGGLHGQGPGVFQETDGAVLKIGAIPETAAVHKVVGEERISSTYHYRVSVVLPVGSPILEDFSETLVGQPGSLFFTAAGNRREIQGVAIAACVEAVLDDHEVSLSVELVPHLALLGLRVHSRIFQDKTAIDVVKEIFEEWGLEFEAQLGEGYAKRAYITQYQESDLAFIERLLASEGVAYYFTQGKTKEKLVLIDDPAGYAPTPSKEGGRAVFSWSVSDNQSYENIFGVRSERRLRPTAARIGDYDFRKPGLALRSVVLAEDERAGFVRKFGAEMLSVYRHGDTTEVAAGGKLDGEERRARVALAQQRGDVEIMNATTRSRRMIPGHIIGLNKHPVDRNNRDWMIVSTKTMLTRARKQDTNAKPESFECRLECVPADHLLRPAFPQRVVRQVSETAMVVGPKGEAVFPDDHGRIKVKFHWDLSSRDDDSASCWLHVSQAWVGANWGSQFVPRVGSEVVVTFLGGDPDRPLVTGSVYNGTHPPPFQLPAEVSTSGFRTQSFPGGEGYNELSFNDRSGSEKLHLRAERDLDVLAQNDSKLNVGRDHELEVKRDLKETVSGAHSLRVVGGQAVLLEKDSDVQVGGDAMMSVTGNYDLRVSNERVTRVEGTDRSDVTGESTSVFHSDQVVRVLGHQVNVIGDSDAQRSVSTHVEGTASTYSTGLTEIASETVMVFRVGESAIRLTPKAIEIFAPNIYLQGDKLSGLFDKQINLHAEKKVNVSSQRIHLAGKAAAIDLLDNARIDGKQVKLNCAPEPEPEGERKEPKPTTITLTDEEGNPLGHQRFVVAHGDGSQRSGVTSDEGKASVLLDASGQIFFPDVDDARKE